MVVKLTQKQDDYLKTFGRQKNLAFYYISSWGWDYPLKDGTEKTYKDNEEKPFNLDEKEKMLNALINGYEVDEPKYKFYTCRETSYLPLYYSGKHNALTLCEDKALEFEKGSKGYLALEYLGFCKEKA
ncbi:hypothetical protein T548_0065 [Lactococcus phage phiL47]|uniref:Uncharacterized protein n=1 Tax=Lactococcus phage phiL47 TaxID=1412875 RepID=V9VES7_9CAUD|nr:hypothetical protein T548_0065 [Lactococcus phage phiL47]AHC94143.1 hypothetical protein T548_0065 [Lactococcus phage phiL47]